MKRDLRLKRQWELSEATGGSDMPRASGLRYWQHLTRANLSTVRPAYRLPGSSTEELNASENHHSGEPTSITQAGGSYSPLRLLSQGSAEKGLCSRMSSGEQVWGYFAEIPALLGQEFLKVGF